MREKKIRRKVKFSKSSSETLARQFANYPDEEWETLIKWRINRGLNSDRLISLRLRGTELLRREAKSQTDPELSLADEILRAPDSDG